LASLVPFTRLSDLGIRHTDVLAPTTLTAAGGIPLPFGSLPHAVGPSALAESTNVTIAYTYDPLNRLTAADYSNGESFEYTYDTLSFWLWE
jgi:YD repeat-containing protein